MLRKDCSQCTPFSTCLFCPCKRNPSSASSASLGRGRRSLPWWILPLLKRGRIAQQQLWCSSTAPGAFWVQKPSVLCPQAQGCIQCRALHLLPWERGWSPAQGTSKGMLLDFFRKPAVDNPLYFVNGSCRALCIVQGWNTEHALDHHQTGWDSKGCSGSLWKAAGLFS